MDKITFSLSCRACRSADPARQTYDYNETVNGLSLTDWTEFELLQLVELINRDLAIKCPFCGSVSLEVLDLTVDGQSRFDYEPLAERCIARALVVFSLTINKAGTQLGPHHVVKPPQVPSGMQGLLLAHLAELVQQRPAHDFAPDARGNFYACTLGYWGDEVRERVCRPLRYTCLGLTREEILFVVETFKDTVGSS